jgi:hypothetical protein
MQIAVDAAIHTLLAALVRLGTYGRGDPFLKFVFVALGKIARPCVILRYLSFPKIPSGP